jgi:CDP-glucose 4,6-dehydratase
VNLNFWRGKRVLVTGHTGFKGSWLSLWLHEVGAVVGGYSLPPASVENLYELAEVGTSVDSVYADVRDLPALKHHFDHFQPEIVFHLAAQALVRRSYEAPIETYEVNVMGTANVLEAVRGCDSCRVALVVTSDKCYENREWNWGYRECDPLGGHDPYSSSKGCAELVTSAYRRSFFGLAGQRSIAIASARAGNVIGGGDFAKDRLVPDLVSAMRKRSVLTIRYPDAIRPWQHVLEPLSGYILLAEKLWCSPQQYADSWNFGPSAQDCRAVRWIVEKINEYSEEGVRWAVDPNERPHEAALLTLDSTKARTALGWQSRWSVETALRSALDWYDAQRRNVSARGAVIRDIEHYEATPVSH